MSIRGIRRVHGGNARGPRGGWSGADNGQDHAVFVIFENRVFLTRTLTRSVPWLGRLGPEWDPCLVFRSCHLLRVPLLVVMGRESCMLPRGGVQTLGRSWHYHGRFLLTR